MNIYLGTIEPESINIGLDVTRQDSYMTPERQTVFIQIKDHAGSSVTFRLRRKDYDFFRLKIANTEGYPK